MVPDCQEPEEPCAAANGNRAARTASTMQAVSMLAAEVLLQGQKPVRATSRHLTPPRLGAAQPAPQPCCRPRAIAACFPNHVSTRGLAANHAVSKASYLRISLSKRLLVTMNRALL